jgi:hypothetical protein
VDGAERAEEERALGGLVVPDDAFERLSRAGRVAAVQLEIGLRRDEVRVALAEPARLLDVRDRLRLHGVAVAVLARADRVDVGEERVPRDRLAV